MRRGPHLRALRWTRGEQEADDGHATDARADLGGRSGPGALLGIALSSTLALPHDTSSHVDGENRRRPEFLHVGSASRHAKTPVVPSATSELGRHTTELALYALDREGPKSSLGLLTQVKGRGHLS